MSKPSRRFRNWLLRFPFSLLDWLPGEEWATFKRLGTSQHVGDLRAILLGTILVAIALIALLLRRDHEWSESEKTITAIVAAAGAIIAWAYQTGAKRLGVVDLVSSEIVTLCRVGTLAEMIPTLTEQYDAIVEQTGKEAEPPATRSETPTPHNGISTLPSRFTSQEDYFPVFASNNRDLQILEARVLANITGFYTYMKALRDTLRSFMEVRSAKPPPPVQAQRHALINVIYMIFLAYESARNAIDDLVEYEPTHAESAMIVLFTEMAACRFLLKTFAEDHPDITGRDQILANEVKKKRFEMRMAQYKIVVPKLCAKVERHKGKKKWEKSQSMVMGLHGAYEIYVTERQPSSLT